MTVSPSTFFRSSWGDTTIEEGDIAGAAGAAGGAEGAAGGAAGGVGGTHVDLQGPRLSLSGESRPGAPRIPQHGTHECDQHRTCMFGALGAPRHGSGASYRGEREAYLREIAEVGRGDAPGALSEVMSRADSCVCMP